MVETLNAGSLALMVSIGHRTGPPDVMAREAPSTSREIATAAGPGTTWDGATARKMAADAGLTRVEVNRLLHDLQSAYYVVRKQGLDCDAWEFGIPEPVCAGRLSK